LVYNESLVEQLAHRDELEYEKEMKNTFISLLLSIQNRRRQFANERKRKALKIDPSQFLTYFVPCPSRSLKDFLTSYQF
uniref:Uncharacterized protein n=1 Tax=Toxocara canis TaxID=6265 RepID=A0A183U168_TOXCA